MLSIINSMSLHGLDGFLVSVEVDVSSGMPSWDVVGLPDTSIKESKERVKAAIKNTGIELKSRKIVVNLSPADVKKEGSIFDLAISIGILMNLGVISNENVKELAFIGELSLNGKINKINGILPMCIEAKKLGLRKIIIPKENEKEASIVNGIEILGISSLKEAIEYLNGNITINPIKSNVEQLFKNTQNCTLDFSEVKGQENIKRALEVAAAGGHNCLLIGNPGSGKTMMARRLPTILPDLTFEEALEVTKIHSIAGILDSNQAIINTRPFRSPHHTISGVSLVGGGRIPKPGEISLAHRGILFLDELPEFNKATLEVLRSPLEDKKVTISRVGASLTYPCNFMLIASMNPCPCGYYGSKDKTCNCTDEMIRKYRSKISGPLLDRIDIHIEVCPVKYSKLESKEHSENSKEIKQRVDEARRIQIQRYKKYGIFSNCELTPTLIEKYCKLDEKPRELLEKAFEKFGLSARAYGRILKVARTIADLDKKESIEIVHIAEAIQYRSLDRNNNII